MTRTAYNAASKTVTINKVKAKHFANQAGLDRLQELLVKATSNPNAGQNYALTIKRAFKSLQECKEPILTQKDALQLKYIGPAMAKKICPQSTGVEVSKTSSKPNKQKEKLATSRSKAAANGGITNDCTNDGNNSSGASLAASGVLGRSPTRLVCPRPSLPSTSKCASSLQASYTAAMTVKEKAYAGAKEQAERLVLPPKGPWKVILLVDGREHKSKQVVSSCKQAGIPCEERHLAIGDMAWIARCVVASETETENENEASAPSKKRKKNDDDKFRTIEILVGTIVERKEVSDLASSLFGTRYAEQRLRLSQCGLPQVLFLVEGNLASLSNCPAETLQMAMMETRINLGFQIVQTKHLTDTVSILKTLHARIVQRTFPDAFGKPSRHSRSAPQTQALPTFGGGNKRRGGRGNRRASSLLELVFDTAPVPPFGRKRFITYPELKAKVEVDRERGTRSVRAITLAMMKQIPTLSQKKCTSIANSYPTLNRLLSTLAYPDSGGKRQHPKKVVQDVEIIDSGRRTIGPNSASEIYAACCTLHDGSTVACHGQEIKPKQAAAATQSSQTRLSPFLLGASLFDKEDNENQKPPAANQLENPLFKKAKTKDSVSARAATSNVRNDSSPKGPSRAFTRRKRPVPVTTNDRVGFIPPITPHGRNNHKNAIENRKTPRFDIGSPSRSKQKLPQRETVDLLTPESNTKGKAKPAKEIVIMDLSDCSKSSSDRICGVSGNRREKTAIAATGTGRTSSTTIGRTKSKSHATSSLKLSAARRKVLAPSVGEDTLLLFADEEDSPLLTNIAAKGVKNRSISALATSDGDDTLLLSPDEDDSPLIGINAFKNGMAKGLASKRFTGPTTKRITQATSGREDRLLLSSDEEDSPFTTNSGRKGALTNHNYQKNGGVNCLRSGSQATPTKMAGKRLSVESSPGESSFLFSNPDETLFTPFQSKGSNRTKSHNSARNNRPFEANSRERTDKSNRDSDNIGIVCLLDDSDDESSGGVGECKRDKTPSHESTTKLLAVGRSDTFVTTTRGGALHSTQESVDHKSDSSVEDLEFGISLRKRLGAIRGKDLKEVIELDSDSE